jgi:hypothetical protein
MSKNNQEDDNKSIAPTTINKPILATNPGKDSPHLDFNSSPSESEKSRNDDIGDHNPLKSPMSPGLIDAEHYNQIHQAKQENILEVKEFFTTADTGEKTYEKNREYAYETPRKV